MDSLDILNQSLLHLPASTQINAKVNWRFIKAKYRATVFRGQKLENLESIICEILEHKPGLSFKEIGVILNLSVYQDNDKNKILDKGEEDVLNAILISLSFDSKMIETLNDKYYLTKIGKYYWVDGIKIKKFPNTQFELLFDSTTSNHVIVSELFSKSANILPLEESSWEFPKKDLLEEQLLIQAPQILNHEKKKLAFYKDIQKEGFQECYQEIEILALKEDCKIEIYALWEGKRNEDLTKILKSDQKFYEEAIDRLNITLIESGILALDPEIISHYKYSISWKRLSLNLNSFDTEIIEHFIDFWDWQILSEKKNINLTNDLLNRFENYWNWETISKSDFINFNENLLSNFLKKWDWPSIINKEKFPKNLKILIRFNRYLNLNKAIEWLSEEDILSKPFKKFVEKNKNSFTPLALENIPLTYEVIEFWSKYDLIKWASERWVTYETYLSPVKAFEGSEEREREIRHYTAGIIDNPGIIWNFPILLKVLEKVDFNAMDFESKRIFSKTISKKLNFKSNEELDKVRSLIDWEEIINNQSIVLDFEFLNTFKSNLDWIQLTKINYLTKNHFLLETFEKHWDWQSISSSDEHNFHKEFLLKYKERLDWKKLSRNKKLNLSEEILDTAKEYLDWEYISGSERINYEIVDKYKEYLSWDKLSSNNHLAIDSLKLDQFKKYWNWEVLSDNLKIEINSYNLREFNKYWNWTKLASLERIQLFLSKFNWNDLSPKEQEKLLLNFSKNYNEIWIWSILKLNTYIPLKQEYLKFIDSKFLWKEIAEDERFALSINNLNTFENKLSWDDLSRNKTLVDSKNILRFRNKWNWKILSEREELIGNEFILKKFKEYWNWDIVSVNYPNFTKEVLKEYVNHWNLSLIDYNKLPIDLEILKLFSERINWNKISEGDYISFTKKTLSGIKDSLNWKVLSQNPNLKFSNAILLSFQDKIEIPEKRYSEVKFTEPVLKGYKNKLNWNLISKEADFEFSENVLQMFENHWNWELLHTNKNLIFTPLILIKYSNKWNINSINYNQIAFDDNILEHFKDKLDWEKLSSLEDLSIVSETLKRFCNKWDWEILSLKTNWDFDDFHSNLLTDFEPYWNWKSLLSNNKILRLKKPDNRKIVASKISELEDKIILKISKVNFSKYFDTSKIYYPSVSIENIFNDKIINKIKNLRETSYHEIILGRDIQKLRELIEYGRANFDEPFREASPEERVLVYCYLNMRKHFFTKTHILRMIKESQIGSYFSNIIFKSEVNLIDIGCGPLTAGLAYADFIKSEFGSKKINYFGVDISENIIKKAKDFSDTPIFTASSKFSFYYNWRQIPDNFQKGKPLIFVFSYLFANLNEKLTEDLADFTQQIILKYEKISPIVLLFQNPNDDNRNKMFYYFLSKVNVRIMGEGQDIVVYRNKNIINSLFEPNNESVKYVLMASNITANRSLYWHLSNN